MIELSILDLLYLTLTFFIVILGALLSLVLIRVLKILSVGVEISNYYWQVKNTLNYYSQIPLVIKDQIFEYFSRKNHGETDEKNATK